MLNFELTPEQKTLVEETKRFTREKIITVAALRFSLPSSNSPAK